MWNFRSNPRISIIKQLGLENLLEKYYKQGLTDEEMASKLSQAADASIQKHHIKAWRKRRGWPANKAKSSTSIFDEEIRKLYEEGLRDSEIAERLDKGRWLVEQWRKDHGLPAHGRYGLLIEEYPEIAEEWHPTLNLPLVPDQFTSGSGKKIWWRCKHDPTYMGSCS